MPKSIFRFAPGRFALGLCLLPVVSALYGFDGTDRDKEGFRRSAIRSERLPSIREIMAPQPVGLTASEEGAWEGQLLVSPLNDSASYLVDTAGAKLREWKAETRPGMSSYLLEDGSLMRASVVPCGPDSPFRSAGGLGGAIERYGPDGSLAWRFEYATDEHYLHHDFCPLPNGNVLAIAWAKASGEEAVSKGRSPDAVFHDTLFYTRLIEVEPTGESGGEIVWQWDAWDHLVQDVDRSKPGYGIVSERRDKIDVNYFRPPPAPRSRAPEEREDEERKERPFQAKIGEVDWMHANSVDYDPRTGYILLSVHGFDEVWVIDRNRPERGLVYRMGNPAAYGGDASDGLLLFRQHDANWIDEGLPGAGNVLLFNNGLTKKEDSRSEVLELSLPLDSPDGGWRSAEPEVVWSFDGSSAGLDKFYARRMSGAQRLPNGNTLVCHGPIGCLMQVDPEGRIVWEYWNEFGRKGPESDSPRHSDSIMPVFKARLYPKGD